MSKKLFTTKLYLYNLHINIINYVIHYYTSNNNTHQYHYLLHRYVFNKKRTSVFTVIINSIKVLKIWNMKKKDALYPFLIENTLSSKEAYFSYTYVLSCMYILVYITRWCRVMKQLIIFMHTNNCVKKTHLWSTFMQYSLHNNFSSFPKLVICIRVNRDKKSPN